jgi:glucans biosynthesis protein C
VLHGLGAWDEVVATGGPSLRSLAYSGWESVVCVSLTVGLIVLFREWVHGEGRLLAAAAEDSYAAYVLHILVVFGVQQAVVRLDLPVLIKFAAVSILGVVLTFGLAHLSRKVPGFRVVLGMAPSPST